MATMIDPATPGAERTAVSVTMSLEEGRALLRELELIDPLPGLMIIALQRELERLVGPEPG